MPKKILLADDSITIQKVVELTFSDGDYEVTAVNNGAKAIQKLSELRPDIILSDIIMPEKNGYEVCEFVKSHPEFRNIPVVLLTGTFEPFDPDRADKAGCDAVVTKPFESQSLIHKVEELIDQARSTAPTAQTPAMPETPAPSASPWAESAATPSMFTPPPPPPPSTGFTHDSDLFGATSQPSGQSEMPFGAPPPAESFSGETRAFPKMSFDEPAQSADEEPAAPAAPSPWDEEPAPPPSETRAFPRMNFEEMQRPTAVPEPEPEPESPFGASPSADSFSGETRAFPKMSFDDTPAPEASAPAQESAPSPWDEQPSYSGETSTFPKMSFEDLDRPASSSAAPATPSPWDEPAPSSSAPIWPAPAEPASAPQESESFSTPETQEMPFGAASSPAEEMPMESEEPAWAPPAEQPSAPAAAPPAAPAAAAHAEGNGMGLSDDEVDRIARRVVQLMSDQVVRNIAWEVIPDLAEMVVKERIRQLESEA